MRRYVLGLAGRKGLSPPAGRRRQPGGRESPPRPAARARRPWSSRPTSTWCCEKNAGRRARLRPRPDRGRGSTASWVTAARHHPGRGQRHRRRRDARRRAADDVVHGPLELLFTVDEETGLTGAVALDAGASLSRPAAPEPRLRGGRRPLHRLRRRRGSPGACCRPGTAVPAGASVLKLPARGLRGGHSGIDIHLQRGNAVQLAGPRALTPPVRFTSAPLPGRQQAQRHWPARPRRG